MAKLQLLAGGISSPSNEDLVSYAERFLMEHSELSELTPEILLQDEEMVETFTMEWCADRQREEDRLKAEHQANVAKQLAAARDICRQKRGVLTQEEIQARILPKVKIDGNSLRLKPPARPVEKEEVATVPLAETSPPEPEIFVIPEAVKALRKTHKMLPALVFTSWVYAAALRGWLCRAIKQFNRFRGVGVDGLDEEYALLLEAYFQRLDGGVKIATTLVEAWGKDPRADRAPEKFFCEIDAVIDENSPLNEFRKIPKPETAEERSARMQTEQAEKDRLARSASLKSQLASHFVKALGMDVKGAECLARNISKNYGSKAVKVDGKYDLESLCRIAAVCKAMVAGQDDHAVTVLALASGMNDDDLRREINHKKAEDAAEEAKRQANSFGSCTRVLDRKKDGDKKNSQKGHKGKKR